MNRAVRLTLGVALLVASSSANSAGTYRTTADGIVVTPATGPEKTVRLQVYGERIVRVTASPTAAQDSPASLMVVARPLRGGFTVSQAAGEVILSTGKVRAIVDLADGDVRFVDAQGEVDLAESGPAVKFSALAGESTISIDAPFAATWGRRQGRGGPPSPEAALASPGKRRP